jgi:hypothetical protein
MAQINQLSTAETLSPSDLIAIYSSNNWDARKASLQALLNLFQAQFAAPELTTQPATPGTGFSIAIASGNTNTWLLLQPAGTLATGTITLPLNTSTLDGTEVLITSTQQITTLTIGGNGATAVYGAPANLGADTGFRLRFYKQYNSWYKV